jgi:lysophospholipase L1-like esterase
MYTHKFLRSIVCLALLLSGVALRAQTVRNTAQWEKEIQAFEASDRTNPPPQNAIEFVGSSSIRKWTNLVQAFPDKPVFNRGFGGSQIPDSTALADRIIFPYHPRMIVFYAGDNDFAAGRTTDQVVAAYHDFVEKIHARLPNTVIAYIAIKPSLMRWKLHEEMAAANAAIKAMPGDYLKFIDTYSPMIGADGKPQPDLFLSDGLHPSEKCYQLWAGIIKPYLK